MTSVQGRVVRPITLDMFADITDVPLVVPTGIDPSGLLFDGDLTANQVVAIHDRMTSRDDADEAKRRTLAADRDALPADDPLRRLYDYLLGDA